jgi:Cd2+/Zn2+-exporting ATPase
VTFLFTIGELLEGIAGTRARAGIEALGALVPRTAMLVEGGTAREVTAASLRVGDLVLVRPGDRVSADGEVVEGESEVDESPVTGESVPVPKAEGAPVFAGSVNASGALHVRVAKAASDNTIARIVRLVEEAQEAKAPTARFIERFSAIYTPARSRSPPWWRWARRS